MQGKYLKRIQTNFGFLKNFRTNFSSNNKVNQEGTPSEKIPYDAIIYSHHSKFVSEIVLNQPKSLNSIDLKMIKTLLKRVRQWVPDSIDQTSEIEESDSDKSADVPKVLLMTGAGEKAFCAGGDIKALYNAKITNVNNKILKDFFR